MERIAHIAKNHDEALLWVVKRSDQAMPVGEEVRI